MRDLRNKPIIIFGTGKAALNLFVQLKKEDYYVVAFSDNNESVWNTSFCGLPVISPGSIRPLYTDFNIFIGSSYRTEIYRKLKNDYRIDPKRIKTLTVFGNGIICNSVVPGDRHVADYLEDSSIYDSDVKYENGRFKYNKPVEHLLYQGVCRNDDAVPVAVFINTRNTNILEQAISYYSNLTLEHITLSLYILDAGTDEYYVNNREVIAKFNIKIKHLRYAYDSMIMGRAFSALEDCDAKYVIRCADDNYITDYGISAAVRVLENEPEVSCVTGDTYVFEDIEHIKYMCGIVEDFENDDVLARFKSCARYGVCETYWTIFRKETLRNILEYLIPCRYYILEDLTMYFLNPLFGKIKKLDMPFHIKQDDLRSGGNEANPRYVFNGMVLDGTFDEACYLFMKKTVTKRLAQLGHTSEEENNRLFDDSFSNLLKYIYGRYVGNEPFERKNGCLDLEQIKLGISIATEFIMIRYKERFSLKGN